MIEELAGHLLGIDIDTEEGWRNVQEEFYKRYGFELYHAEQLINDLLPLCEVAKSPLTGKLYQGFADTNCKGFDYVFRGKQVANSCDKETNIETIIRILGKTQQYISCEVQEQ